MSDQPIVLRAVQAHEEGRLGQAEELYRAAFDADRTDVRAHMGLASLLAQTGQMEPALAAYDAIIEQAPDEPAPYIDRADVLMALGWNARALESLRRAASLGAEGALIQQRLGQALFRLGRPAEALAHLDRAVAMNPSFVPAHRDRGAALRALKRPAEAVASLEHAIALAPTDTEAFVALAHLFMAIGQFESARDVSARALAQRPDLVSALIAHGGALLRLNQIDDALASLDQAVELEPTNLSALSNRGDALKRAKRYDEAIAAFARALNIKPDLPYRLGEWMHAKLLICDWSDFEAGCTTIRRRVDAGEPAIMPFQQLIMPSTPRQQFIAARTHAAIAAGERAEAPAPYRHDRLRVGYFSNDFREHATAFLLARVLELHDRSKVEVVIFDFSPAGDDGMRQRLRRAADRWIDIGDLTDAAAAKTARTMEIDIAVDLKGYTFGARPQIFGARAAPIQVNWLGHPGGMGAPFIDYIIADQTLIPEQDRENYSESVCYLPDTYQPNDPSRAISPRKFSREELGLPARGFVFCCFNNGFKITPDVFDIWMRLLREIEGSALWLLQDNPRMAENLRAEAAERGVDPSRLILAQRIPLEAHLARHAQADLFLDTFHCSAHTTASDALWAGLPVLAHYGQTFAGRVSSSLLSAIGLPELIASTAQDYEAMALDLARNPDRLGALRAKLMTQRTSAPLFDAARFTRHLEAAFTAMQARALSGLPPTPIFVEPIN